MGRLLRRASVLAAFGVLATGGAAFGWEGNGNNNGWDNKQVRGCPDDYGLIAVTTSAQGLSDLNGDGKVCAKLSGNSGANYIDNISNH